MNLLAPSLSQQSDEAAFETIDLTINLFPVLLFFFLVFHSLIFSQQKTSSSSSLALSRFSSSFFLWRLLEPTVAVDLAFAPEKKQGKKKKEKERRFSLSNGLQYSRPTIAGKREEHIIKAPNHPHS